MMGSDFSHNITLCSVIIQLDFLKYCEPECGIYHSKYLKNKNHTSTSQDFLQQFIVFSGSLASIFNMCESSGATKMRIVAGI